MSLAVTFYSYKGGVGRTMALLNTAGALMRQGKKVLIWELDLEAPGLLELPPFADLKKKALAGTINILAAPEADLKAQLQGMVLQHSQELLILPAGAPTDAYFQTYNQVPWKELFIGEKPIGNNLLLAIRLALEDLFAPDFLLIDARTGITDLGAVSTLQLPEVIVLVMQMSRQGAQGAATVQRLFQGALSSVTKFRENPLIYRIASHVPATSALLARRRSELKAQGLGAHFEVPLQPDLLVEESVNTFNESGTARTIPFEDLAAKLIADAEPERQSTIATRFERLPGDRHTKGKTFEEKVVEVLRLLDFTVEPNTHRDGRQIDFIARKSDDLEDRVYLGECKDHAKPTGVADIDSLFARVSSQKREEPNVQGLLISREGFTAEAREHARKLGLVLWTYDQLLTRLVNLNGYDQSLLRDYEGQDIERLYVEQDVYPETGGGEKIALKACIERFIADDSANFQLLLGDYGTGKTWFTRKLAAELAQRHQKNPSTERQPIRISLRDVAKALDLDGILHTHFQRQLGRSLNPQALLRLNEEGRLILIFDAFDEMATQSDWEVTRQNFREILKTINGQAKVVLTCRTHYFKDQSFVDRLVKGLPAPDLGDKHTELYREVFGRQGLRTAFLRGFDEAQMAQYVERACGAKSSEVLALIHGSEPLQQIGEKPVLLEMIVKSAPQLDRLGRDIAVADLYAIYTEEWFERQDWRMRFTRENRRELVQELALRLWGKDTARIHYTELRDIVAGFLPDESKTVQNLDAADHEVRTAAFLIRDPEGNYGFSHRSFLEYFLACALKNKGPSALAIPKLSPPVLKFLGELVEPEQLTNWCRDVLTKPYRALASENAVHLWKTLGTPALGAPLQLSGAQLEGIDLIGAPMENADLRNADLFGAKLPGPRLTGADLSSANLAGATLDGVAEKSMRLDSVDLRYTRLWDGRSLNASLVQPVGFASVRSIASSKAYLAVAEGTRIRLLNWSTGVWKTLAGHEASVLSVAWSPDGRTLASGSDDKTVRLWEPDSGRALRILSGHQGNVLSVAWAPDGRTLASGSSDNSIRLWEPYSGRLLRTFHHDNTVNSVAWAPDGRTLASGSSDNTVRLWEPDSGRAIRTLYGHEQTVTSVAWAPDGRTLASGSSDDTVCLWDPETGRAIRTLDDHESRVWSVAWSPDGRVLASGSEDATICLWEPNSGRAIRSLDGHYLGVLSVAWAPDGRTLASLSEEMSVRIWEPTSGRAIRTLVGHQAHVLAVAWAPDGRTLASGSTDNTVRLWEPNSGRPLRTLDGHQDALFSVAWAPDGRTLASGSYDDTIRLWEADSGRALRTLAGHKNSVWSVAWAPDGRFLASGSSDDTIRVWEADSGCALHTLAGHTNIVWSVAWAPDGRTLASGSHDKTVRLWEPGSGHPLRTLVGHENIVRSVAWAPDGRTLASASVDETVRLWDVATGRCLAVLWHQPGGGCVTYVLAEDGQTIEAFVTDPESRSKLLFTHGFVDYPYEAFAHLENPDLVARRLRGE